MRQAKKSSDDWYSALCTVWCSRADNRACFLLLLSHHAAGHSGPLLFSVCVHWLNGIAAALFYALLQLAKHGQVGGQGSLQHATQVLAPFHSCCCVDLCASACCLLRSHSNMCGQNHGKVALSSSAVACTCARVMFQGCRCCGCTGLCVPRVRATSHLHTYICLRSCSALPHDEILTKRFWFSSC
jgi:hypothetical protein